jgi:hypothetical protein
MEVYYTTHDASRNPKRNHRENFVDHTDLEKLGLKYISDSSHHWREETFCEAVEKKIPRLYVLIHPEWWYVTSSVENY